MFDRNIMLDKCKSGHDFELWVQNFLLSFGFDAKLTGGNDNGVDIIATKELQGKIYKFYIQCKFHNRPIGKIAVQEVYTGYNYFGGDGYPVVITTNRMTSEAKFYAKKMGVEVIAEEQFNEIKVAFKHRKRLNENLTGLFGFIIGCVLQESEKALKALKACDEIPILNIEEPTEKEQMKQEIMSAFDQADILLQEAAEKQADVFRTQQQALALQKSAILKNLEYG